MCGIENVFPYKPFIPVVIPFCMRYHDHCDNGRGALSYSELSRVIILQVNNMTQHTKLTAKSLQQIPGFNYKIEGILPLANLQ